MVAKHELNQQFLGMKAVFNTHPILSFILITFSTTFAFWFLPALVSMPKDLGLATLLLGGCGPLIAGYVITVIRSEGRFRIKAKPVFFAVFLAAALVLLLRIYFTNRGLSDINGKMPGLHDVSIWGYILFGIVCFILGMNASNAKNKNLKENYLRSFLFEKGKLKWYLLGFLFFMVLKLGSYGIGSLLKVDTTDFILKPDPIWLIGFFSTFFFFGGNEEFGWRGFLQKELQKKYSPLAGALFISFLWSLWHLPLHYNGIYSTGGFMDLLPRFIWTIPLTIVFTWLYNKSSYSILAVVLLHAMFNNVDKAFGSSEIVFLVLAFLFTVFCIVDDSMWRKKSYHLVYEKAETEGSGN